MVTDMRISEGFLDVFRAKCWINWIFWLSGIVFLNRVSSLSQNISVPDQLSAGSYVGKIGNGLPGVAGPFSIFADTTTTAVFNISATDGSIMSKVKVERSKQVYYYLTAFSHSGVQVDVTLVVVVSGNRAPLFRPSSVNLTLSIELQLEGSLIFISTVFDPDEKGFVSRCDIVLPSSENPRRFPFALRKTEAPDDSLTLELQIISVSYLSISHSFIVRATDNASPPLQTDLPVDIYVAGKGGNKSNHAPVFDRDIYELTVNENLQLKSNLVQIQASDPDLGDVVNYSFDASYPEFSIHPANGWVTLVAPLDSSKSSYITLKVVASDTKDRSIAQIRITVTASPEVGINLVFLSDDATAKIPRSANTDDKVAYVSVENVDRSFAYNISLDGGEERFALRPAGDLMCLVVVSRSLSDARTSYSMAVRFYYSAHPEKSVSKTFMLMVTGGSDHNPDGGQFPQFEKGSYEATLPSNSQVGQSLIQVSLIPSTSSGNISTAESINRPKFRLSSSVFSKYFRINSTSGWIIIASLFDCTFPSRFSIEVEAYQAYPSVGASSRNVARASVLIVMNWDVRFLREPRFEKAHYVFRTARPSIGVTKCFGKVGYFCNVTRL